MDEEILINFKKNDPALKRADEKKATNIKKKPVATKNEAKRPKRALERKWLILLIVGVVGFVAGLACLLFAVLRPQGEIDALTFPKIPSEKQDNSNYSLLTGNPLREGENKNAPTFCIQTPNGTDGARPQVGLTEAGVVFEAIAEAGITRFAAIYQNPTSAIIGPIRSLRTYYLDWDTPFDCTIVHAGGAADALAAVSSGGYRNFDENYQYMYRGTYSNRLWNNLFITSASLKQFNTDHGYNSSDIKGFSRMTPEESNKSRAERIANEKLNITKATEENTSKLNPEASLIHLRFGGLANFNVDYAYDENTNTYLRSYASGVAHDVYQCSSENLGERNPEDVCELTTLAPAVVIAMKVREGRASDNYHENITTAGSGEAYIFQNGSVVRGTWQKASRADQIRFLDGNGEEILLAPGQTFISAVPNYGSVEF